MTHLAAALATAAPAQVLLTAALMANAFLSAPRLWVIYVLGAVLAATSSLQRSSREALLPRVVRHQQIPAAIALSSLGREAMLMAMPIVLFPALATMVFHAPAVLGLLYSAEGVGALIATASSGWISHVHHHGRAIVIAASAWSLRAPRICSAASSVR